MDRADSPRTLVRSIVLTTGRAASYVWAFPYTAIGLFIGLCSGRGARFQWNEGVLEASGGGVASFLHHIPVGGEVLAVALGHVILARSEHDLAETREHERVHVAQFAKWGPFFLPAYVIASFLAAAARRDPYRGNAFERQAFRPADRREKRGSPP